MFQNQLRRNEMTRILVTCTGKGHEFKVAGRKQAHGHNCVTTRALAEDGNDFLVQCPLCRAIKRFKDVN